MHKEADLAADRRKREGSEVSRLAREELGQFVWPETKDTSMATASAAIALMAQNPSLPAVEVPMHFGDVYARADALIPSAGGYILRETKASSYPLNKDKSATGKPDADHVMDVAIQAWVMANSGIPCVGMELNLLDNQWRYPRSGDYSGLFKQLPVMDEVLEVLAEVPLLVASATQVLNGPMPTVTTGTQCTKGHPCPFQDFCKQHDPKGPVHPIELLPGSAGKSLAKKLKASLGYTSLLDPSPSDLVGAGKQLYLRMQKAHASGVAILEPNAGDALSLLPYPRYFFDFEGIDYAVPVWVGVRPYEQVTFQWSCHIEDSPGVFRHVEFLDLSGGDPSLACISAMLAAIPTGAEPILVYSATYEKGRLAELAHRHPSYAPQLESYISRLVDLLPMVKEGYYHPEMKGSFSLKKVVAAAVTQLAYGGLNEVQDGIQAQLAYLEAVGAPTVTAARKSEIELNSLAYCKQDTWSMVQVAGLLTGTSVSVMPPP